MRHLAAITLALSALLLGGCVSTVRPSPAVLAAGCPQTGISDAGDEIFLLTSRLPDCRDPLNVKLTGLRGGVVDETGDTGTRDPMRFGFAHASGSQAIFLSDADIWWEKLAGRIQQSGGAGALIFFHGYNNAPEAVLRRAAMIRQKTHFKGPVIAFLWPSQASLTKYTWDEANDDWTRRYAENALEHLARISPRVTIVAHSMGNRIAGDAVAALDRGDRALAARMRTIVLASPDVDRDIFVRDFPHMLDIPGRNVTVYASAHDIALYLSAGIHGYKQAGDVSCRFSFSRARTAKRPRCYLPLEPSAGLTVVDTTPVSTGQGHADFIESPAGAADFCRVINGLPKIGRDTTNPRAALLTSAAETGDACQAGQP